MARKLEDDKFEDINDKIDFANHCKTKLEILERIEAITNFDSNDKSEFKRNYYRKFCGRDFFNKSVWVGAFFENDLKFYIGFCSSKNSSDVENVIKKENLTISHSESDFFEKDDYWYYIEKNVLISGDIPQKTAKDYLKQLIEKLALDMKL